MWPSSMPILWLCICLAAILCPVGRAAAEKRVALIIGNGVYKAQRSLDNPPNDARLIGGSLAKARFEIIETKTNLGIAEFRQALRRFQAQANGADVALVYFAGHGIEANGNNWLIPTDAELAEDRDLDYEAIKADLVLQALQGAKMRVLVLDACRDNPFGRNWRTGVRNTGTGLAKIEADDVLVLFAAAPGRTASDGIGGNSPFATALAKRLPEPGLAIQFLGGSVRDDVLAATGGNQRPYVSASITGRPFYLVPGDKVAPTQPSVEAAKPPSTTSAAAREWQDVKDTANVAVIDRYLQRHKDDPVYAALAQDRLETLKRQQQAALAKAEANKATELGVQPKAAPAPKPQQQAAATTPAPAPNREACDTVRTVETDGSSSCLVAGRGDAFKDCSECPDLVVVPAGSFMMGSPASEPQRYDSEGPQRRVTIAKPFAVARYAVTFAEWDACVAAGGCGGYKPADEGWGRGKRPVINVHWDDAKAYVAWITKKSGQPYRLLNEAEREYATRAGTTTPFWWGSSITPKQANYDGSVEPYKGGGAKGEYRRTTMPVDAFEANPWGLYQVHGNVWEWVEDCWHDTYQGAPTDGSAWIAACTDASRRVVRGGSWDGIPQDLRSADRSGISAVVRGNFLSFRLARTLNP